MKIDLKHLVATSQCRFEEAYGLDVFMYEGIAWGPPTTAELIEAVKVFPLDPRDVLVTGYPKSGTNWMQIMVANFWDDWGTYLATGSRRVPSIEYIGNGTDGYDIAIRAPAPRLMKNHLPIKAMPQNWASAGSKIVYMTRNPFDVCASFFRQLQVPGLNFDADWDKWVERFAYGYTLSGGWLEHVRGWHLQGPQTNVHHVSYEKLRRDPIGEMRKVVAFLGKPLADTRFDDVVEKARMENMDRSGFSSQITVADLSHYRAGGMVGEARRRFSQSQVDLFEERLLEPLRAAGVPVDTN